MSTLLYAYTRVECARNIEKAFSSPTEMRKAFPSLDNFKYKDKWWVINLGGNTLRLMAFIEFRDKRMYVKHIVTHAQYDKLCKKYRKSGG